MSFEATRSRVASVARGLFAQVAQALGGIVEVRRHITDDIELGADGLRVELTTNSDGDPIAVRWRVNDSDWQGADPEVLERVAGAIAAVRRGHKDIRVACPDHGYQAVVPDDVKVEPYPPPEEGTRVTMKMRCEECVKEPRAQDAAERLGGSGEEGAKR